MLVLAVFAMASTAVAIATGQRIAAFATAGFGVAALILFLVIDLPDVGQLGDIEAPAFGLATAEAVPQAGFWLGAISAVVLGLAGIAFATLSSEQLRAPKRLLDRHRSDNEPKPAERTPPDPRAQTAGHVAGQPHAGSDAPPAGRPVRRHPRKERLTQPAPSSGGANGAHSAAVCHSRKRLRSLGPRRRPEQAR